MKSKLALLAAFLTLASVSPAHAGARRFTYLYETTTAAPGSIEIENWVTWRTDKRSDSAFDELAFRHEIEFGITPHFQAAIYVADWKYETDSEKSETSYSDSALELIYNFSHPTADLFGSAIYGEVKVGDELIALEGKILLQKNVGRFVFGYNAAIEGEWEGRHQEERNGEFQQTLGISYQINPSFMIGAELLHEIDLPDWAATEDSVVYAGPNFSYRHGKWWVTATPLIQLTDIADEPDFQTRVIFGFEF